MSETGLVPVPAPDAVLTPDLAEDWPITPEISGVNTDFDGETPDGNAAA
jgi:hypothetical protein